MTFQRDIDKISGIAAIPTILDVVAKTTGMGFTAVARVTEDRWITCASRDDLAFGLKPGDELKVETTICHEIRQNHQPVIIDHVSNDPVFASHHTPAMYGLQSYISMPIILPNGSFFGTLCAIDPKPHKLNTPEIIGMFKLFAELIAFHLDAADKLELSAGALALEKKTSVLREQFIAVLGHDLRNPLASIAGGIRLLRKTPDPELILKHMQASVTRMSGIIDNVMDFARSRLGGGVKLTFADEELAPIIAHIVSEFEIANPERAIVCDIAVPGTVHVDAGRIGQLVSNLLGNALAYGTPEQPIMVIARPSGKGFTISVSNKGTPIAASVMPLLFTAFQRGDVQASQQGLGLGLYIAMEIARAHKGTILVSSSDNETTFTVEIPN